MTGGFSVNHAGTRVDVAIICVLKMCFLKIYIGKSMCNTLNSVAFMVVVSTNNSKISVK